MATYGGPGCTRLGWDAEQERRWRCLWQDNATGTSWQQHLANVLSNSFQDKTLALYGFAAFRMTAFF
jgi:hypothetical protein